MVPARLQTAFLVPKLREDESGLIRLLEIHSGAVRAQFRGHRDGVQSLAFSPDGRTLASGGQDNVVFLWDVTGVHQKAAETHVSQTRLAQCWDDLVSHKANRAGDAMAFLIRHPKQTVPFLKTHLVPTRPVTKRRLARLLAELDAKRYRVRVAASQELLALREQARPALQKALRSNPTLEVKLRIDRILDTMALSLPSPATVRQLRGIEVLEHIGSKAATARLKILAQGDPIALATRHACEGLSRLAK